MIQLPASVADDADRFEFIRLVTKSRVSGGGTFPLGGTVNPNAIMRQEGTPKNDEQWFLRRLAVISRGATTAGPYGVYIIETDPADTGVGGLVNPSAQSFDLRRWVAATAAAVPLGFQEDRIATLDGAVNQIRLLPGETFYVSAASFSGPANNAYTWAWKATWAVCRDRRIRS